MMTKDYRILPDIYWGDSISISPFFFTAKKLMLAIPPKGDCSTDILFVERFSYGAQIEYKDGFHEKVDFNPRKLMGFSDSIEKKLKQDSDIITLEWNIDDFANRQRDHLGIREELTPEKILKIGPHHEGTEISNEKKKWLVSLYNWAYLLNDENFDMDKSVIEIVPKDEDFRSDFLETNLLKLFANEAFKLSIPNIETLSLDEALDIRNEYKNYLNPFWRTIQRLQFDVSQFIFLEKKLTEKNLHDIARSSIKYNLGTTLEGWSEELNNNLLKIDSLKKTKKFSKIFLDVLTGILKKDLSKLFETLIGLPEDAKTPSQTIENDFDKTIKFLYYLKSDNMQNNKL